MRIVLDTNVLVSGLLNPNGAPGRIVDLIIAGQVQVLYDDRILGEYREVLSRPQLAIDPSSAQALIDYLRLSGEYVLALPLPETTLPDPNDVMFAEVAVSGKADAVVTSNSRHFSGMKTGDVKICSPSEFIQWLVVPINLTGTV